MSSEILADADHKMARAVEVMERDFQGDPDRPRLDRARRAHPRRVLRHVDAAQPAGRDQRPGAAPDRHPALGPRRPRRDREGDHEERHRPDAQRRRHGRPAQHPAAHRGASQGPRPSRPQADGGGAGRDPQPAPRCRRPAQEGGARRRASAPTRRTASSRSCRRRPTGTSPRSIASAPPRNRRSWRSSGPRTARPADRRAARGARAGTRGDRPRGAPPPARRRCAGEELPRHVAIIMDGNRRWARGSAACPSSRATRPASRPSASSSATPSGAGVPVADAVRLQPRELGALATTRSPACSACSRRRSGARPTSCARRASAIRLLGRLEELPGGRPARRSTEALAATAGRRPAACSTSPSTTPAGRARRRRPAAASPSGLAADEIDEDAIGARALHGRPARPRPRHPDRRRAAPLQLPHLAVGLRRAATSRDALWPDFGPDAFDDALVEFARRHRRFGR